MYRDTLRDQNFDSELGLGNLPLNLDVDTLQQEPSLKRRQGLGTPASPPSQSLGPKNTTPNVSWRITRISLEANPTRELEEQKAQKKEDGRKRKTTRDLNNASKVQSMLEGVVNDFVGARGTGWTERTSSLRKVAVWWPGPQIPAQDAERYREGVTGKSLTISRHFQTVYQSRLTLVTRWCWRRRGKRNCGNGRRLSSSKHF
ncbi:hypothetical protein K438DRAFT_1746764 [Mycena galopus ATCC 62051]|nr:hypothetical protein K438DRAFT_1746764 [Mycena galopus ATCC 62051]